MGRRSVLGQMHSRRWVREPRLLRWRAFVVPGCTRGPPPVAAPGRSPAGGRHGAATGVTNTGVDDGPVPELSTAWTRTVYRCPLSSSGTTA